MPTDTLYTVAFVQAPAEQLQWVQAIRAAHDPRASAIEPHYTLLFGLAEVPIREYLAHVAMIAGATSPIDFVCRRVELTVIEPEHRAFLYLVPDEGRSDLAALHHRLYTGPLRPFLRLDLPYLPHITIGSTLDWGLAEALCKSLNAQSPILAGQVSSLTVGALRSGKFIQLANHQIAA